MTVVLASLIAVPLATILARFRFRGAALIHTLGVVPLVMPPFVGAVAMQLIYGRNGTINLMLLDCFGFRIPFMEGLNGVIFVEALHYFPFILLNLSASLANIDSAMEESAQNLGAHGLRCSRASCSRWRCRATSRAPRLVFVKVFDDLATPLLLNVTNMLAPQAYLKITSVGIADPMGYVISVIMIICSVGAMALSALVLRGPRFRHRAARRRRARAALARPHRQRRRRPLRACWCCTGAVAAHRHFPAVDRHRVVVRRAARRLYARPLRDGVPRGRAVTSPTPCSTAGWPG